VRARERRYVQIREKATHLVLQPICARYQSILRGPLSRQSDFCARGWVQRAGVDGEQFELHAWTDGPRGWRRDGRAGVGGRTVRPVDSPLQADGVRAAGPDEGRRGAGC
jgi:hypothetical protein